MQSLSELNLFSLNSSIDVVDRRPSNVIFNTNLIYDQDINITSTSVIVPAPIDIEEIINYQLADVRYRVTIESTDPTFKNNSLVSWPSLPAGVTLTSANGVYTLSGIDNVQQWKEVKTVTWTLPADYETFNNFNLKFEIIWYSEELDDEVARSWIVYDTDFYFIAALSSTTSITMPFVRRRRVSPALSSSFRLQAEQGVKTLFDSDFLTTATLSITGQVITPVTGNAVVNNFATLYARPKVDPWVGDFVGFNYTSGTTQKITGIPLFQDGNVSATYTVTITPTRNNAISTFTNTGTGGSFSVNPTTKIITIAGSASQVNNRLQNLFLVSLNFQDWDFDLNYTAVNEFGEVTTATQRLKSINQTYLTTAVDETFRLNTTESITTPTIALTQSGNYRLDIYSDAGSNINSLSSQWAAINWDTVGLLNIPTTGNRETLRITPDGTRCLVYNTRLYDPARDYLPNNSINVYTLSGNSATLEQTLNTDELNDTNFTTLGCVINAAGNRITFVVRRRVINSTTCYIYVFTRSGSTWNRTAKFIDNTPDIGISLAASDDGNYIAISSLQSPSTNRGSVNIYYWTGSVWNLQQTITEPNPTNGNRFGGGLRMSADGRYLVIVSYYNVYIYYRSGLTFDTIQFTRYTNPLIYYRDFGVSSFSSDGTRIVISTGSDLVTKTPATLNFYRRTGSTWNLEKSLTSPIPEYPRYSPGALGVELNPSGTFATILGDWYDLAQTNSVSTYALINNQWYPQETVVDNTLYSPADPGFPGRFAWGFTLLRSSNIPFNSGSLIAGSSSDFQGITVKDNWRRWNINGYTLISVKANASDFNSGTKTYTYIGDRQSINLALTSFALNSPAADDIDLIYKLTTPGGVIVFRNQRIIRI